jgi:hypothetical protein
LEKKGIFVKVDVVIRAKPEEMLEIEFFIRQKYRTEDSANEVRCSSFDVAKFDH